MKNLLVRTLLVAGTIWLALSGCSEDVEPNPPTYSQLLTGDSSKAWQLTGLSLLEADQQPVRFSIPNNCIYDDFYVFYADENHTYEIQEGLSKCSQNDPDVFFTGSWAIVNATATIQFPFPIFGSATHTLRELTETTMIFELYNERDNYRYQVTFTARQE